MPCFGVVAQLVRASACHAEGRGFEPLQSRQLNKKHVRNDVFFCLTRFLDPISAFAPPQNRMILRASTEGNDVRRMARL